MLPINRKRAIAASVAGALALGAVPLFNNTAIATASANAERLAGDDRYETAALVAQDSFPDGATNAIIAYGLNFPDALAASYLAGFVDGPILLTDTNDVPDFTTQALDDLAVDTCYIVGGFQVVGAGAQSELEEHCDTTRIFGGTRYETAREIATSAPDANVGTLGTKGRTAFVATGEKFADALAAGPIAAAEDFPVILTRPESLSPEASEALDDLEIDHVLLPGGTAAVSAAVQAAIQAKDITVQRFSGADRQHTAVLLAEFAAEELEEDLDHINVAAGADSSGGADALALAPHGAKESPTLLCETSASCGATTLEFIEDHASTIASVHIAGGTVRISQNAEDEVVEAAQSTGEAPTITKAEAVDATTVKLTMSEAVESSGGGELDPSQFSYDKDGSGSGAGVAATSATISSDGLTITLKFPASTVDTSATGDTVVYNDDNDAAADDGDVVDANGNQLADETETVSNAATPAPPTMTKAISVGDNVAVVTFSEIVSGSGGSIDAGQFSYTPGSGGGQSAPVLTEATEASLSADGRQVVLTFPDDTFQLDPATGQNPFDAIVYNDDNDAAVEAGDIVDAENTAMKDGTIVLDAGSRPTITGTAIESSTVLAITFNEAVRGFGGTVDRDQWRYDADGSGLDPGVSPNNATFSDDGKTLRLTFAPGTLQSDSSTDVVRYTDSTPDVPDNGDIVDVDGAPLANTTSSGQAVGNQPTQATAPQVTSVTAVDTSTLRVLFGEPVIVAGGHNNEANFRNQFLYDPNQTVGDPATSPSSVEVLGDIVTLRFASPVVVPGAANDLFAYNDDDDARLDDGDPATTSDPNNAPDVTDHHGTPLVDVTPLPVEDGTAGAPVILDAHPVDATTVRVFLDEAVAGSGPVVLDKAQWTYDANPADATTGVAATGAVANGNEITLTFAAVQVNDPDDVVAYADAGANDAPGNDGDVTDGTAEMSNQTAAVDGEQTETAEPDIDSQSVSTDRRTVTVTLSEPVRSFGGVALEAAQFKWGQAGDATTPGQGVPATSATIDAANSRIIIVTFSAPVPVVGEIFYDDDNAAAPDAGDVIDNAGNQLPENSNPD